VSFILTSLCPGLDLIVSINVSSRALYMTTIQPSQLFWLVVRIAASLHSYQLAPKQLHKSIRMRHNIAF
jgi:hypothetical protein